MLGVLRYNFSSPNFISPLTKIPIQAHKLFWAPTNISNILPKYFPYITQLGLSQIFPILLPNLSSTNISHTSPINYFGPSQIFFILPSLGPHKYLSYHYQNWATKLCHLYKSPNSFTLWANPKKPNKTLL